MQIRNQIVGLVRFSFATLGEFYPGFDGIDAMEAFLFDPDRLARRFVLFEVFCLPSLRQQTDPDFRCILLVGANMPQPWKARLQDLCAGVPAIQIVEAAPDYHYTGIKKALLHVPSDGCSHRTTFRFDDDDALDNGFIARLKAIAPKAIEIGGADNPVAIGHNLGFYLEQQPDKTIVYPTCERTPLSVGAALCAPISFSENIYRHNHRALGEYFNLYSDTQHFTFVRTVHRDNKSNPRRSGHKLKMPNTEIDRILQENFGRKLGHFKHLHTVSV